jgi:ABC-2 type transport system permease protein
VKKVSKDLTKSKSIGGAFGYLIMMFIIIWKHGDAQCYRRKTSRIVEIIIFSETISIDDGKIIGTSLAGLLQSLIWAIIGMSLLLQLRHFRSNVGPTARVSPEMMQTAQQEMTGTAQMYIKELWNFTHCKYLD